MAEEARKKQLEEAHKERKRELRAASAEVHDQALSRQAQLDRQRGQNIASAVGGGIGALGSIATGLDTRSIKTNHYDDDALKSLADGKTINYNELLKVGGYKSEPDAIDNGRRKANI